MNARPCRAPFILRAALLLFAALAQFGYAEEKPPEIEVHASADLLALHVSGKAPAGTTGLQYRIAESGPLAAGAEWSAVQASIGNDGAFAFDVPLKTSRWSAVQMRALKGEAVLATRERQAPPARAFRMLTEERIAALPESERVAWSEYVRVSNRRREAEFDVLAGECRALGMMRAKPAPSNRAQFENRHEDDKAWLAGEEAGRLVEAILSFQTPSGGWSKAVDYSPGSRQPSMHWTSQGGDGGWHYCGTLDNRSTTEQIRFLASVYSITRRAEAREGLMRGLEWLFAAQFPNGGWPQNYPVEPGYHEAITLNDDAMTHVLEVLVDVSEARPPFAFAEEPLRQRARASFDRGLACLAAAQVKVDGQLTVWCAQHDSLTLAPVGARLKEPPSLSGGESAVLLKFLMRRGPLDARCTAMIEPALQWLDTHRITGLRYTKNAAGRADYISDPTSPEVYWARFYDIETAKPMFVGAQDGIAYATFAEMAARNRVGYDYYTTRPRELLEKEVERWRKRFTSDQ